MRNKHVYEPFKPYLLFFIRNVIPFVFLSGKKKKIKNTDFWATFNPECKLDLYQRRKVMKSQLNEHGGD